MHLTSILPLKFKRADYCPFDQFDQITLHFLLQFRTRHFQRWAIPEKIQTLAKGSFSTWNFQSRGIEESAHKNPRVHLKRKWNFWGF